MDIYSIVVQFIGFVACIFLIISYYGKSTNHILSIQIISTALFCVHYFLLGAYSGLLICNYEMIRDLLYYKTDYDDEIYKGSVIVYGLTVFYTCFSLLDIFPYIGSAIDGYFLTKKRETVVLGGIVTYSLWLIYNIFVGSYPAIVTDIIIIISNLYILFFRKEKTIKK